MEYDELELEKLGEEKIALFAVVSDSCLLYTSRCV